MSLDRVLSPDNHPKPSRSARQPCHTRKSPAPSDDPECHHKTTSQNRQRLLRRGALVVAILGVAGSCASFVWLRSLYQERFEAHVSELTNNLNRTYQSYVTSGVMLAGYGMLRQAEQSYAKNGELDSRSLAPAGMPADTSFKTHLFWAPRRGAETQPLKPVRGSTLVEGARKGSARQGAESADPTRVAYFPIEAVAPEEGAEAFLGIDLASDELLHAAMLTSAYTASSVLIGRPGISSGATLSNRWFYIRPLFQGGTVPSLAERSALFTGCLVLYSRSSTTTFPVAGLEHILFRLPSEQDGGSEPSLTAAEVRRLFFSYLGQEEGSWHAEPYDVRIINRPWTLISHPTAALVASQRSPWPPVALAIGLLLTTLVALFLFSTSNHFGRIEALVDRRTRALKQSEERFKTLFEFAPDPCWLLDHDGHLLDANRVAETLFGFRRHEVIGQPAFELPILPSHQRDTALSMHEKARRGEPTEPTEFVLRDRSGGLIVAEVQAVLVDLEEKSAIMGVARDVTERKRAEDALRESEQRYALAARGATDGLWDWDLRNNSIYFAPRWKEMLGYGDSDIGTDPEEWLDRVHPEDKPALRTALDEHISRHSEQFVNEHRIRDRWGRYRWMLCRGVAVHDDKGVATRLVGSQTEISERKAAEGRLKHEALHDALTGLPNRALFMEQLADALANPTGDGTFAVLFLDIDRFKVINDSLGHFVGDSLLVAIGERLRNCVRAEDMVARLGGDEFTLLLRHVDELEEALHVVRRIQKALSEPFKLEQREIIVTASIGVTLGSYGYERSSQLLRDADIAMYRAKAQGKACFEVFTQNMRHQAAAILDLETDLRRALEQQQLILYYQPIINLSSRRVCGLEALIRWAHPERGLILPDEFITLAEELGLILPIGEWVIRESCAMARSCLDLLHPEQAADFWISVNLSPLQLKCSQLAEQVGQALTASGLPAHHLKLEITESVVIEDADAELTNLLALQELGVGILLDDFGTGYSSLQYLGRFAVDALKIDRAFVNSDLLKAISTLAHSLDIEVIAEGVENPQQLERAVQAECEYAQGFYFAAAISSDDALAMLHRADTPLGTVKTEPGSIVVINTN